MILNTEEAEKFYRCHKKYIYSICCSFSDAPFFDMFFFLFKYWAILFILLLLYLAKGEIVSLLRLQHTKQLCACISL